LYFLGFPLLILSVFYTFCGKGFDGYTSWESVGLGRTISVRYSVIYSFSTHRKKLNERIQVSIVAPFLPSQIMLEGDTAKGALRL
jgi:hypothetical protein